MYVILSFGYSIVDGLKPVMASEKVKVNYGTEEALLAVVDKTKSHKIISWREQCGNLTKELFMQCPLLYEAKELLHLFDFEPYRADQAEQAQGEGVRTEQTQSVQSPDPVPYMYESRPGSHYPPRESPPGDQVDYGSQGRRDWPPRLPRALSFDGRTSWHSFLRKFTSYAASYQWSPGECLDVLGWCLEGPASDCFSSLRDMGTESYYNMLTEMGRRFGATRFPEEAIAEFRTARQLPEESLLGWSDRLQALFCEAFGSGQRGDVSQLVLQLCQGCTDKAAGLTALNKRPRSVEEALEAIRWAQHTQRVVYGSEPRRLYPAPRQQVQQTCLYDQQGESYDEVEEPGIYRHRQPYRSPTVPKDVPRPAPVQDRGNVTALLEKDVGSLKVDMGGVKKELASLRTRMDNMESMLAEVLKTVKSLEVSRFPRDRSTCPVKSVSFAATEEAGNPEGSESEVDLRSGEEEAYNQ